MADVHTPKQRSYNMSRIRCKDTKSELKVKDCFENKGFVYQPDLYGKPDFVHFNKNVVIFIDGCFWHKCPKCFKLPETNKEFWRDKINKNVLRDKEVTKNYEASGWKVIRIWGCQIKKNKEIYK